MTNKFSGRQNAIEKIIKYIYFYILLYNYILYIYIQYIYFTIYLYIVYLHTHYIKMFNENKYTIVVGKSAINSNNNKNRK